MQQRERVGARWVGALPRRLWWVVGLAACGESSADPDGSTARGPDGRAGICCPIDAGTCNAFRVGGWAPSLAQCPMVWDAAPPVRIETDAYGCPRLIATGSCLDPDGGTEDAARNVPVDSARDGDDAAVMMCPGSTACHPFRVSGAHSGACPPVVDYGAACTERCLACMPTGPDGGPGLGSGDPCVCDGTRWVCPSDSAGTCPTNSTCWIAGAPPACM